MPVSSLDVGGQLLDRSDGDQHALAPIDQPVVAKQLLGLFEVDELKVAKLSSDGSPDRFG